MLWISIAYEDHTTENVQRTPPSAGMKYMEYCSGGVSEIIAKEDDSSCLAEKPGEFAKIAIGIYSSILFLIFPILYSIYIYTKRVILHLRGSV